MIPINLTKLKNEILCVYNCVSCVKIHFNVLQFNIAREKFLQTFSRVMLNEQFTSI